MTIRTILLHVAAETCDPATGPAAYALQLAKHCEASLTTLIFELEMAMPKSAYGRRIAAEAQSDLVARNDEVSWHSRRLQQAAQAIGLDIEVQSGRSYAYTLPEVVAETGRLHDLLVVGVGEEGLLSEHAIAEYALFQSGRPLIVVPASQPECFSLERAVVAWDFSRAAARAVSDALPLLRQSEDVVVVAFGDDKEMESSLSRDDVIAALEKRGVRACYEQVERREYSIPEAINAFCLYQKANLLVMGGYGHSRMREFILGGATRGILEKPALPTFLSH